MRVDVVVILEPGGQLLKDGDGVWPWVHAGIVTFQGFDEGLADAVAFRATDRREAWNKVQGCGEVGGFGGGIQPRRDGGADAPHNLRSLCPHHHNTRRRGGKRGAAGTDAMGWPLPGR